MIEPHHDAFEAVHVELEWHDGPQAGLADVDGEPHYFRAVPDVVHRDECDEEHPYDEYLVWPAEPQALNEEREQWGIFVRWYTGYKNGTASIDNHPFPSGVDARFDQLTVLLEPHRVIPKNARRLRAEWQRLQWPHRYDANGPGYFVRWNAVDPANRTRCEHLDQA